LGGYIEKNAEYFEIGLKKGGVYKKIEELLIA